jgi:hypothetical protein
MSAVDFAFEHATEFIPERWYSRPDLVHDKRAFAPFTTGMDMQPFSPGLAP